MALEKLYETEAGKSPSIIIYRNMPDQLFIQFQEEGMSINDFTVDDRLLHNNDIHRVHDFGKGEDKIPTKAQRDAFQIARNWLLGQE